MDLLEQKDIYFERAFFYCAKEKEGYGGQTAIAHSMGVSLSYINQIATGKKKPGFKAQQKIASACGYDYESFLKLGQNLIQQESGSAPTTKQRSIKQTNAEVSKEDAVTMDDDVKQILQDHIETLKENEERGRLAHESAIAGLRADFEKERQAHERAMAELREDYKELKAENKELKAENKEFRLEYKQLLEQYRALKQKKAQSSQSPDKPEEKKAVNL